MSNVHLLSLAGLAGWLAEPLGVRALAPSGRALPVKAADSSKYSHQVVDPELHW